VLDGIWREEILIKWEHYWDALGKRLKREDAGEMSFSPRTKERFIVKASESLKVMREEDLHQSEKSKSQNDLAKEVQTFIYEIWFEGLPDYVRGCIWSIIADNTINITEEVYFGLRE
jgi:hypothetical protein